MRARLEDARVVIVAGPGGVGKTTSAAALATALAGGERSTLVATIDPAPRLLDALGLSGADPGPHPVPGAVASALGVAPETLLAARLDAARVFRHLVEAAVSDPDARARVIANPIYHQITTSLTGTQELAAMLALWEFLAAPAPPRVVLDTPPASNALDFFDAPARLRAAAEGAIVRALMAPGRGASSLRRLGAGGALLLGRLSRLVGSRFLEDVAGFLRDFEPVLRVFLTRAASVDAVLRAPSTALVLVTSAERPAIEETIVFARQLEARGLRASAVVVNRCLPAPRLSGAAELGTALARFAGPREGPAVDRLAEAVAALARASALHDAERARLGAALPGCAVFPVPLHRSGDYLDELRRTAASWS